MKSKIISLSAITAAFVTIVLTLGSYLSFADIFCIIISSVFVIMPLYYKSYKGCFLSFLAGGAITALTSLPVLAISFVLPAYFSFFGVYPIVKFLLKEKEVNKRICFIIGLVWCVAVFYGIYFYYTFVMGFSVNDLPEFFSKYLLIFIAPIAIIFFVVYDRFVFVCKNLIDRYLNRIVK